MHHRPAGPPLSVRLTAAFRRTWLFVRYRLRRSGRRVAVGIVATVAVTAVLLAVPVTVSVPEALSLDPSAGSSSSSASSSSASSADRSAAESSTSVFPENPLPSAPAPSPSPSPSSSSSGTVPAPSAEAPPLATAEAPSPAPEAAPGAAPMPSAPADAPPTPASPSAAATAPRETSAPAPAPAAAVTPAVLGVEAEVLSLVNAARADAGCGALVADPGLAAVARAHSADMRDRGFFAHVNLAGQDPFQRASAAGVIARAENIARGQQDAAGVMASWMDSPGHRANILDCDLRSLGVGVATGAGGPWWTQVFG